jgi:hypothetical protein
MKQAALGFRAHSGWTALVAVCLERNQPEVLLRQRPKLVERFTYEFRQPYHTAEKMSADKAPEFVSSVELAATRMAEAAIRTTQLELGKRGYEVTCFGLPSPSAKPLPSLDKILRSHALIHTADGALFRRALIHAGKQCQIAGITFEERQLMAVACTTLKISEDDLKSSLTSLGKPIGSPWSQDEKFATMAAWLALLHQAKPKRRGL